MPQLSETTIIKIKRNKKKKNKIYSFDHVTHGNNCCSIVFITYNKFLFFINDRISNTEI